VRREVACGAASGEFLARRPFTHPNLRSVTLRAMRTWERDDPDLGRPIAARSTDTQRLWQVLTTRDGKIVHIHDYTNQATALQAAGLPTGP
jgi:hypothetical protein